MSQSVTTAAAIRLAATTAPAVPMVRARRRFGLSFLVVSSIIGSATALLFTGQHAQAGIVPTVSMGTAANYSVLAATTVTNTNLSVLGQSVGLSPGTSVTGFPPGVVLPPALIETTNATTIQAQIDLTAAYVDAAGRSVEFTQTNPDLVGQTLVPGVYAATAKAPLGLSGQLVLDGQNNPNAVFIFQTDSTLITSSGSSIILINGATECNVFWQVGSSATLGTGSVFVGSILALTSVTVQSGVIVRGRALARNGAVTLDNAVFTQPSCVPSVAVAPTTTTTTAPATTTTVAQTGTTVAATTTIAAAVNTASTPVFDVTEITLPETGRSTGSTSALGAMALLLGAGALIVARRRTS